MTVRAIKRFLPRTVRCHPVATGLLFPLLLWCQSACAVLIDEIAAVVNEDVILRSELIELVEPYRQQYAAKYNGDELEARVRAAARTLLERAIEKMLLLQEAKKRGIEIEQQKIDEALKEIQGRFRSDEEFRKALEDQDETIATLREKVQEDLLVSRVTALKRQEVDKEITISEQEVRDYYETHKSDFATSCTLKVAMIFVRADKSMPTEETQKKKTRMEELLAELKGGADVQQLAQKFSEDARGAPVEIGRGDLPAEIEQTVFSMNEGDLSDILESEQGFYIVKVLSIAGQKNSEIANARAKIELLLREQRVQEKCNNWLKQLRDEARVSIYFR